MVWQLIRDLDGQLSARALAQKRPGSAGKAHLGDNLPHDNAQAVDVGLCGVLQIPYNLRRYPAPGGLPQAVCMISRICSLAARWVSMSKPYRPDIHLILIVPQTWHIICVARLGRR